MRAKAQNGRGERQAEAPGREASARQAPHPVQVLQRALGNQALARMAAGSPAGAGAPGAPLDPHTRSALERTFGASLADVRVHTGAHTDAAARSLNARAFTYGADIFFRDGAYRPDTIPGRALLRHELTHVLQSAGAAPGAGPTEARVVDRGSSLEHEARSAAASAGAEHRRWSRTGGMAIYRSPADEEIRTSEPPLSMRMTLEVSALSVEDLEFERGRIADALDSRDLLPSDRNRLVAAQDAIVAELRRRYGAASAGAPTIPRPLQIPADSVGPALPSSAEVPPPIPEAKAMTREVQFLGHGEGSTWIEGKTALQRDAGGENRDIPFALPGALAGRPCKSVKVVLSHGHVDHYRLMMKLADGMTLTPGSFVVDPAQLKASAGLRDYLNKLAAMGSGAPGAGPAPEALAPEAESGSPLGRAELELGTIFVDFYFLQKRRAHLEERTAEGKVQAQHQDAAIPLMVVRQAGTGLLDVAMGDLRLEQIHEFREAIGDEGFFGIFRNATNVFGMHHHLGVINSPGDLHGFYDLLDAVGGRRAGMRVIVQTGSDQQNKVLAKALRLNGIEIEVVLENTGKQPAALVQTGAEPVQYVRQGSKRYVPSQGLQDTLSRLDALANLYQALQQRDLGLERGEAERIRPILAQLAQEAAKLEAERRRLTIDPLLLKGGGRKKDSAQRAHMRMLKFDVRRIGRLNAQAESLVAGAEKALGPDVLELAKSEREVERGAWEYQAQLQYDWLLSRAISEREASWGTAETADEKDAPKPEGKQGAPAETETSIDEALDRGETVASPEELGRLAGPERLTQIERRARGLAKSGAMAEEVARYRRTELRMAADMETMMDASRRGGGDPVGGAAQLLMDAETLLQRVAETRDSRLYQAMLTLRWWLQRGITPPCKGIVDRLRPRIGIMLMYPHLSPFVPLEQNQEVTEVGEALRMASTGEIQGLEVGWPASLDGLEAWADANVKTYDDFYFHFMAEGSGSPIIWEDDKWQPKEWKWSEWAGQSSLDEIPDKQDRVASMMWRLMRKAPAPMKDELLAPGVRRFRSDYKLYGPNLQQIVSEAQFINWDGKNPPARFREVVVPGPGGEVPDGYTLVTGADTATYETILRARATHAGAELLPTMQAPATDYNIRRPVVGWFGVSFAVALARTDALEVAEVPEKK